MSAQPRCSICDMPSTHDTVRKGLLLLSVPLCDRHFVLAEGSPTGDLRTGRPAPHAIVTVTERDPDTVPADTWAARCSCGAVWRISVDGDDLFDWADAHEEAAG